MEGACLHVGDIAQEEHAGEQKWKVGHDAG